MDAKKNESIHTAWGDYIIVARIADGCPEGRSESMHLYVGRHSDGHHDLLLDDNASVYPVGNEDDAELNLSQWDTIADYFEVMDLGAVKAIDAKLADWLDERRKEAKNAIVVVDAKCYSVWGDTHRDVIKSDDSIIEDAIAGHWWDIANDSIILRGIGYDKGMWHITGTPIDISAAWTRGECPPFTLWLSQASVAEDGQYTDWIPLAFYDVKGQIVARLDWDSGVKNLLYIMPDGTRIKL